MLIQRTLRAAGGQLIKELIKRPGVKSSSLGKQKIQALIGHGFSIRHKIFDQRLFGAVMESIKRLNKSFGNTWVIINGIREASENALVSVLGERLCQTLNDNPPDRLAQGFGHTQTAQKGQPLFLERGKPLFVQTSIPQHPVYDISRLSIAQSDRVGQRVRGGSHQSQAAVVILFLFLVHIGYNLLELRHGFLNNIRGISGEIRRIKFWIYQKYQRPDSRILKLIIRRVKNGLFQHRDNKAKRLGTRIGDRPVAQCRYRHLFITGIICAADNLSQFFRRHKTHHKLLCLGITIQCHPFQGLQAFRHIFPGTLRILNNPRDSLDTAFIDIYLFLYKLSVKRVRGRHCRRSYRRN